MRKHIKTVKLLFANFGFNAKYLFIPVYRFLYFIFNRTALVLDELFFSGYRKKKIDHPIFLIGHPRSGTTFLHKFLLNNTNEFIGMVLWKMLFSTLFFRTLLKPALPLVNKLFPKNLYDPKIHKTGFLEPETDDVALFFNKMEGMFHWLYFEALNVYKSDDQLEKDLINACNLPKVLLNLENLYKKNLFHAKPEQRIFSKSFSLILDLHKVAASFQNAKIIVIVRDPMEVVPSSMSLARNVQQNLNNFEKLAEDKRNNYYKNLYQASIIFYKSLLAQLEDPKLKDRVLVINYNDLIQHFSDTMNRVIEFCQIIDKKNLLDAVAQQEAKQQNYKGKHVYTLEEFGLKEEDILRDFNFLYSRFKF